MGAVHAPAKPCVQCSQSDKQAEKEVKISSASQPVANHFQVPEFAGGNQPCLVPGFEFACPTLLGKASLPAKQRGSWARQSNGFFSRLLIGSISAQAP